MRPARQRNRLTEYDYSQPGAYFVTICTKDRKCILSRIVGGDAYIAPHAELTAIGMTVERYLRSIPGIAEYVIMPNHVHMILRISATDPREGPMWASAPTKANVPQLIRSWKILVTKNLGYGIWQRSYYDHVIRNERDYVAKAQYILDNPAKWCDDDYYCG